MNKQIILSDDGRVVREAVLNDNGVMLLRSKAHQDPEDGVWLEPTDEVTLTWEEFNRIISEHQTELAVEYKSAPPAPPMSHAFSKGDHVRLVIPDEAQAWMKAQRAQSLSSLPFSIPSLAASGHEFIIAEAIPVYDDELGQWCWRADMSDLPFWGVLPESWLQPA